MRLEYEYLAGLALRYREDDVQVNPDENDLLFPALTLGVYGPSGAFVRIGAILDSGADSSSFPFEVADLLGLQLPLLVRLSIRKPYLRWLQRVYGMVLGHRHGKIDTASGPTFELEFENTSLRVEFDGGQEVELPAIFCATPAPILGRDDFFRHYVVTIDETRQRFYLEPQSP